MKTTYATDPESRFRSRMAQRLKTIGYKLESKKGGYAILVWNDVAGCYIEAEGLTPVPYSLGMEDVIRLTHEYFANAEIEELRAAEAQERDGSRLHLIALGDR